MSEIDKTIETLESELGLKSGFFNGLQSEDDWSFVIKCHALMETACSFLLTAYFNKPNYGDIFSRIEMSDTKKGKVAFLKEAGLVIPEEAKFIIALSELRNKLVHNISEVAFKFKNHISSLDANQKKSFVKKLGYAYLESDDKGKLVISNGDFILSNPKRTIYEGVKVILGIIMLQVKESRFHEEAEEHKKRIYDLMTTNK